MNMSSQQNSSSEEQDLIILLEAVPRDTPKEKLADVLDGFFKVLARFNKAKIISTLNYAVKDRFGLIHKVIEAYEKTVLDYKKDFAIEDIQGKNDKGEKEAYSDEEIAEAKKILSSPKPLFQVLEYIKRLGLAGEERNALIHYLAFSSRILDQPISVIVKGDSSAGKSFTLNRVMKIIPKSAYIDLTDATPQSFYYGKEDMFKHKIIVLFERQGMDKTEYPIRTLQSEGKLKIQVTVKNPETGQFEAQEIEREGPAGFITTTTASGIHTENETRNLSIYPDQSVGQTLRIYEATEEKYLGKKKEPEAETKKYQAIQLCLEAIPVYIPYLKSIGKRFPSGVMRTRRDYGRFIALIEISAFFHQHLRNRVERESGTHIQATLADYEVARILSEDYFLKSIYEIPPRTIEIIEAARELASVEGDNEASFTLTNLSKFLGWDRDTVTKWMKPAEKKTYITLVEESKGRKGARYRLETDKRLPDKKFLAELSVMAYENPNESLDNIYDPLTGGDIRVEPVDAVEALKVVELIEEGKQPEPLSEQEPLREIPF